MPPSQANILEDLKVHQLPSLPHVLVDMLHACQGNKMSFQDLAVIISRDAAVAARVVSLANSSFFSRGAKINGLERALLVLGTDTIKTLVITAAIQQFFSGFNSGHTDFLKAFWKRSLSCALLSKSIAILTSYPNPEEAYLTGLLHNIGELVLQSNYPSEFNQLLEQYQSERERSEQERQMFSVSHAEVGAWLLNEWELDEFMADAIEYHHADNTRIRDAHHLVKIVHLASLLSEPQVINQQFHFETAEEVFELNASLVSEIVNKIDSEVIGIARSMGIKLDEDQDDSGQADERKQIELAKQVRNIGLLQSAASELNRATSKAELGLSFQSSLELLFGYAHSAVFWYEQESNELSCVLPSDSEAVPIKLKMEPERSLVARAAIERSILCSNDSELAITELPVVDQQLIRVAHAKGIICIPIHSDDQLFCVLCVGSNDSIETKYQQINLLRYFADEIALACEKTLSHIANHTQHQVVSDLTLRVSELVHEANNPLNIISNYLSNLGHKLGAEHEAQEELKVLKEEVERTGHILLRLKDLQHSSIDQEPGVEINQEIESLVSLYKSSLFLTHDIHCELNLDPNMRRNKANRNTVRQMLTNLIKNGVEAMPEGGTISISTLDKVNVNGSDFAEIIVQDNGPGIPQTILKDLFSPVSSTKGTGHSGLGLSITKNLVTEAQGTISCRSNTQGTRFQILLPAYVDPIESIKAKN